VRIGRRAGTVRVPGAARLLPAVLGQHLVQRQQSPGLLLSRPRAVPPLSLSLVSSTSSLCGISASALRGTAEAILIGCAPETQRIRSKTAAEASYATKQHVGELRSSQAAQGFHSEVGAAWPVARAASRGGRGRSKHSAETEWRQDPGGPTYPRGAPGALGRGSGAPVWQGAGMGRSGGDASTERSAAVKQLHFLRALSPSPGPRCHLP